jgi:hypothetical protein
VGTGREAFRKPGEALTAAGAIALTT